MKKIGLALGGGGAKGLAHIPMLEVFDELGVRPHRIAGTSIGAVLGAAYASGAGAARLRAAVDRMIISKGESFQKILKKKDVLKWVQFLDVDFRGRGLFKGDRFVEFLYASIGKKTFTDLEIPLRVVATDFWTSGQVVLDSGDLLAAVKASMGLPGVFTPVELAGRTLIDGGAVNPVPHDVLEDCDLVVAIDVMGRLSREGGAEPPNAVRAVLETFDIMQRSIVAAKARLRPPDIYIAPEIVGVDILEFFKAEQVYEQAAPAAARLRSELQKLLGISA
jgi:NTE family protein